MATLVHRFPSVSIFNIGDLLAQARAVIDKAVTAVQSVFLFTLLAGLTVLLAQVQASREERRHEIAILRVLGARRVDDGRQRAGGVLVVGRARRHPRLERRGSAASAWLAHTLDLHYRFDVLIWGVGVVASTLVRSAAGVCRYATDSERAAARGAVLETLAICGGALSLPAQCAMVTVAQAWATGWPLQVSPSIVS